MPPHEEKDLELEGTGLRLCMENYTEELRCVQSAYRSHPIEMELLHNREWRANPFYR